MASRVLYWGSGSIPAWRALLALEEKGLSYESKLIEFSKGEHKSPEVLALNPRGQVPTFKDGDAVVNESLAIIAYLEHTYPEPSLLPVGNAARALVWQRFIESGDLYTKLVAALRMKFRGEVETEEQQAQFAAKMGEATAELKIWDGYLSSAGGFVAGDTFSIADVAVAPILVALNRFGATLKDLPNIKAYVEKMKGRPSITATWPPHWKTSPNQEWAAEYM